MWRTPHNTSLWRLTRWNPFVTLPIERSAPASGGRKAHLASPELPTVKVVVALCVKGFAPALSERCLRAQANAAEESPAQGVGETGSA